MLRSIAERLNLPTIDQQAQQPGVRAAYRVTIRYHDRRAHDSVATLVQRGPQGADLETVYEGLFQRKPLRFAVEPAAFTAFSQGLALAGFDHRVDQEDIPSYGVDLWLFERAAAGYHHGIIVAPALASREHWALIKLAYTHLPEAVREIPVA